MKKNNEEKQDEKGKKEPILKRYFFPTILNGIVIKASSQEEANLIAAKKFTN